MSDIPSDLFHNILRRVPADSLLRFRAVCKEWRSLIDDPSFVKSHTENQLSSTTLLIRNSIDDIPRLYSLSLDSLNYSDNDAHQVIDVIPVKTLRRAGVPKIPALPVASCNGLILLSHSDIKKIWAIWNPLTREFHELPKFRKENSRCLISHGFGYDSASDDYKVMRVDELFRHDYSTVYQTSVYSLKSDTWRILKDCHCHYYSMTPGVYLNGALHWTSWHIIIAFVFRTESYEMMRLPSPIFGEAEPSKLYIDALGGCLVVSYYYTMDRMDGWVMKDYGDDESWVKFFSFGGLGSIGGMWNLRPIAYFKSKGHVILQNDDKLFWLDCESNLVKKVTVNGLPYDFSCQSFPGSLFRLDQSRAAAVKSSAGMKRKRRRNKADARVKHSVRITDAWFRSDSEASWSSNGDD